MNQKTKIYIIYTAEDKEMMNSLLGHLKSVRVDEDVVIWSDNPIRKGQRWKPIDESRLDKTDIFILLLSNAFMYSEFIKQLEFKKVIDSYKAGRSKVIPVILENCPWDIDFEADEYTFSFKELHVLPEGGKPINQWESIDHAFQTTATFIKSVLPSLREDDNPEILLNEEAEDPEMDEIEDQLPIPFSEEEAAKSRNEEEIRPREEAESQKRAEEERRLSVEALAKQEEAEKRRLQEVAQVKRRKEEAQKQKEEAEAIRKAEWLQKRTEDKSRIEIAGEAEPYVKEGVQLSDGTNLRKRILLGTLVAALVIIGVFLFTPDSSEASEELPSEPKESITVQDTETKSEPIPDKKSTTSNLNAAASLSRPKIGQRYDNGIIFDIDDNGKDGMIAHLEDFGPIIWNDAIKIEEQLGEGWRLPTFDELYLMYSTIGQGASNKGKFADELYWSATPYDSNQARLVRFRDGNTSYHYNSRGNHRKFLVRAVRDFEQ